MTETELPGWSWQKRDDGMKVVESAAGFWRVRSNDGRPLVAECPCCDTLLRTARAAKLVADFVYPRAILPVGPLFPVERKPE